MRTLGVDLSSQPAKTAACLIEWGEDGAEVLTLTTRLTDDDILALAEDLERSGDWGAGDAIGVDAPFGWPQPFVEFVGRSPLSTMPFEAWDDDRRKQLCFRQTDLRVHEDLELWPLTVAAEKIAMPAMRCAGILRALEVQDRSGGDGVFEVYPAAALKAWGLPHRKYKQTKRNDPVAKKVLNDLCERVCNNCGRLTFSNESERMRCSQDDHAFDSLVAALVARAAALGRTVRPRNEEEDLSRVEGWIAVPNKGFLIGDLHAD